MKMWNRQKLFVHFLFHCFLQKKSHSSHRTISYMTKAIFTHFEQNHNKTPKTGLDMKVTCTHWKLLVQLVGEQRVWELPKIELTEGTHRMDVLDIRFFCQVGDVFRVKFMASKDSRGENYLIKGKTRMWLQNRKQRPKALTSTSVNEYFLKWLHLDFSSNWMLDHKTSAFVCGN